LARLAVNQLDPTPPWYCQQEINWWEADHHRALQVEVAVVVVVVAAEEAVA
jgi:hypothetical protein